MPDSFTNQHPPFRRGRRYANTEKRQTRDIQDRPRQAQRTVYKHRCQAIWQQLYIHNAPFRITGAPGSIYVLQLALGEYLSPREPNEIWHKGDGNSNYYGWDGVAENGHHHHGQNERRERHEDVRGAHYHHVHQPTCVASQGADQQTQRDGDGDRCEGDGQVQPGTLRDPRQYVAPEAVSP